MNQEDLASGALRSVSGFRFRSNHFSLEVINFHWQMFYLYYTLIRIEQILHFSRFISAESLGKLLIHKKTCVKIITLTDIFHLHEISTVKIGDT